MPGFTICTKHMQFIIAIFTLVSMGAGGILWATSTIATKKDMLLLKESLSKQTKLQYIDTSIKISDTAMLIYESRIDNLTPAEQRKYEQLKSMNRRQLQEYREITGEN